MDPKWPQSKQTLNANECTYIYLNIYIPQCHLFPARAFGWGVASKCESKAFGRAEVRQELSLQRLHPALGTFPGKFKYGKPGAFTRKTNGCVSGGLLSQSGVYMISTLQKLEPKWPQRTLHKHTCSNSISIGTTPKHTLVSTHIEPIMDYGPCNGSITAPIMGPSMAPEWAP